MKKIFIILGISTFAVLLFWGISFYISVQPGKMNPFINPNQSNKITLHIEPQEKRVLLSWSTEQTFKYSPKIRWAEADNQGEFGGIDALEKKEREYSLFITPYDGNVMKGEALFLKSKKYLLQIIYNEEISSEIIPISLEYLK